MAHNPVLLLANANLAFISNIIACPLRISNPIYFQILSCKIYTEIVVSVTNICENENKSVHLLVFIYHYCWCWEFYFQNSSPIFIVDG